jgi:hypothetical protein
MDLAEASLSTIGGSAETAMTHSHDLMDVKTYLDNKLLLGRDYFPAVLAGFAAWAVARDIVSGSPLRSVSSESELKIPPDEWDPCFFASLAITGGAIWEGIEEPDKRHRFWNWYLTTAVPEAFTAAAQL